MELVKQKVNTKRGKLFILDNQKMSCFACVLVPELVCTLPIFPWLIKWVVFHQRQLAQQAYSLIGA